jgi:hypothetical protein
MATTTPNFGWSVPTSTDLVKDGATAIETLGDSIDASLVDLKGGTTGQVLAKNSNTDMDFTWAAIDPLVILDAKGDLITATAADTPARLAVGTNGQVLTADSTASTGLKWATAGSGLTKIVTADFSASAAVQINQCFTSTYVNYIIVLNALGNSGGGAMYMQFQTGTNTVVSSSDYFGGGWSVTNGNSTATFTNNSGTFFTIAPTVATNLRQNFTINVSNVGNSSQDGNISSLGNGSGNGIATYAGIINAAATYTGVRFTGNGNLTGTYTVYGLAK